jgi:hypothetical protein
VTRTWTWTNGRARRTRTARWLAAAVLRAAGNALAKLATQLDKAATPPAPSIFDTGDPTLEFHAEAGAPEGALYLNGILIGHLSGVSRL